jgi:hypothetical protein
MTSASSSRAPVYATLPPSLPAEVRLASHDVTVTTGHCTPATSPLWFWGGQAVAAGVGVAVGALVGAVVGDTVGAPVGMPVGARVWRTVVATAVEPHDGGADDGCELHVSLDPFNANTSSRLWSSCCHSAGNLQRLNSQVSRRCNGFSGAVGPGLPAYSAAGSLSARATYTATSSTASVPPICFAEMPSSNMARQNGHAVATLVACVSTA